VKRRKREESERKLEAVEGVWTCAEGEIWLF